MKRERALKIVLVVVGVLFFCAALYPLVLMVKQDPALAMMMSLYATLGVFLLLASRNPSAHCSLIAFAAWSSFAHAGIMSLQAFLNMISRRELIGSAFFIVIGLALIVLAPTKQTAEPSIPRCVQISPVHAVSHVAELATHLRISAEASSRSPPIPPVISTAPSGNSVAMCQNRPVLIGVVLVNDPDDGS
jgi:uncharacterized protein DUF6632